MSDPVRDLKRELLAAAERQQGHAAVRAGRFGRHRRILTAAALSIAAAVALLVVAPWSSSPGFLEDAQAALTPPAGTIVHQRWELTATSTDLGCTVTRGPNEIWIDQRPPYTYRALVNDLPADPGDADPRELACSSGTAAELGGAFDEGETLMFVPPNTLETLRARFVFPLDPVKELRDAISAGRAHEEGETQLDGRVVKRIRVDPPSDCSSPECPREPSYTYVDPETFHPVQTECDCGALALPGRPVVRVHLVMRYLTFEYLPRTDANLALTDIRAQHPDATGP
jgi:hypothetical protein